eukprot:TRINITY_DN2365_c0_g1_i3.p1 TRINITY_DN2365_c0_g1~~TRINITY_DN2365_c0_g1_i3.p1  ORF type:complete len:229 (+),score=69.39 TRINITY_DN2365_c0_g1_i3:201-887(+)
MDPEDAESRERSEGDIPEELVSLLIQYFMKKAVLSFEELDQFLRLSISHFPESSLVLERDADNILSRANLVLEEYMLTIRMHCAAYEQSSCFLPTPGYALCNDLDVESFQLSLSPAEVVWFNCILNSILDGQEHQQPGRISRREAILATQSKDTHRVNSFIKRMKEEGWIVEDENDGMLFLGIRARIELTGWLKMEDKDLEEEDSVKKEYLNRIIDATQNPIFQAVLQ